MSYGIIDGRIVDIHKGSSATGRECVEIKFETDADESNPGYPVIRLWFTPKTISFDGQKIARLFEFAGLKEELRYFENERGFREAQLKVGNPKTVQDALKILSREEFVYLKIPINCTPNEYEGNVSTQYDIGWKLMECTPDEDSAFAAFADILAERKMKSAPEKKKEVYDVPF